MKRYEAQGYYVVRSAGSHGLFDLVAIHLDRKEVVLIDCKLYKREIQNGEFSAESKAIIEKTKHFNAQGFSMRVVLA